MNEKADHTYCTVPVCFGLIDGVHLLPQPTVRTVTQRSMTG